jgi:hypothetical protein
MEAYPNFEYSGVELIQLHGGDCIFVPALTWYQVQATPRFGQNLSNILLDIVYPPSSAMLLALMSAVENRIIT